MLAAFKQRIYPDLETQGGSHQKSKTGVSVARKKDVCPPILLKKKECDDERMDELWESDCMAY